MKSFRNTYVEIETKKIYENIDKIKQTFIGYDYYIAVVKGNAYGHGFEICKYLLDAGINYFAVSNLDEALQVRKFIDLSVDIMLLNPIEKEFYDECIKNNIAITISNLEHFNDVLKYEYKKDLKFHLKLNTGMNRLGINNKENVTYIFNECQKENAAKLIGIYTHLSTSGYADIFYDKQINKFLYLTDNIDLNKIKIRHIFRSNSIEYHNKLDFCNGCRLGLIIYGYTQNFPYYSNSFKDKLRKMKLNYKRKKFNISKTNDQNLLSLKPYFSLKSKVLDVHNVEVGQIIGYGINYINEDKKVAVVDIGYADGLSQKLTGANVIINSKKYKIIATINMCNITVLVDDNVKIGDEVILINEEISPKKIATHCKSTPYVVMSMISPFIKRIYRG